MITCDTSKAVEQLKKFHADAVRRMTHMVYKFSIAVGIVATGRTPMGSSALYPDWYNKRVTDNTWESYGLQPQSGFARGSWRLSTDGTLELQEIYGRGSGDLAVEQMKSDFSGYKLGDTVLISNFGPYIRRLEDNYSKQTGGQGIMKPTVEQIMNIYQHRLDEYYRSAK